MKGSLEQLRSPERLPDALSRFGSSQAWLRGGGTVADVVLRCIKPDGGLSDRHFSGTAQLISLEAYRLGSTVSAPSVVIAREAEGGLETLAGTLVEARVVDVTLLVVDLAPSATVQAATAPAATAPAPAPVVRETPPAAPAVTPRVGEAPREALGLSSPMPQRPARRTESDAPGTVVPDAGDVVEHFAFGMCDVLKTDGDRIHLRVQKDQRIKEIAPEMLRIVAIDLEGTPRRFRLERKL